MRCSFYRPLLDAYVEGTLPPAQRARVAAHLTECDECRALFDEFRTIDALLLKPRKLEPAPNFTFKVMAELRTLPRPQRRHVPPLRILAAYLAFAWVVIGLFSLFGDGPAHAAWIFLGESLTRGGDGFAALVRATSDLFGPHTFRITAAVSGLLGVDLILAAIVAGALYVRRRGARPGIAP